MAKLLNKIVETDGNLPDEIYIRFGEVPKDGLSTIYSNGKPIGKEKGVSVYAGGIEGKYVYVEDTEMNHAFTFNHLKSENKFAYLVTGTPLNQRGSDGEHLLKNVRIIKTVPSKLIVLASELDFLGESSLKKTLAGIGMAGLVAAGGMAAKQHNDAQATEMSGQHTYGEGDWAYQKKEHFKEDYIGSEAHMLALTMWGEARNQGAHGMLAVGHVIVNRVGDKRWDDTIKGVVTAKKQFSCWNPNDENRMKIAQVVRMEQLPHDSDEFLSYLKENHIDWDKYQKAKQLAQKIISGESHDFTDGAVFYHTDAVKPVWRRGVSYIGQIGDHMFYR